MVIRISKVPKTRGATRQPNEFIPNSASPPAISHLPIGGWTMKDAAFSITSTFPATMDELAVLGHCRS